MVVAWSVAQQDNVLVPFNGTRVTRRAHLVRHAELMSGVRQIRVQEDGQAASCAADAPH
jgi:hypothetical protein